MTAANLLDEKVSAIMTRQLHTAPLSASLHQAYHLLADNKIRHLPIVDKGKLIGIVSLTDLRNLGFVDIYKEGQSEIEKGISDFLSIEQVMKANPTFIQENDSVLETVRILVSSEFHALPVLKGSELVGIVSTNDVIRYMATKLGSQI